MNSGIVSHQNEAFLDSDGDGQMSVSTIISNLPYSGKVWRGKSLAILVNYP